MRLAALALAIFVPVLFKLCLPKKFLSATLTLPVLAPMVTKAVVMDTYFKKGRDNASVMACTLL